MACGWLMCCWTIPNPLCRYLSTWWPLAMRLQRLLQTLQERGPAGLAELPLQPPYAWDDCGWVANRWVELLPAPPELKHRLMTLDNPLLRLELVADLLERLNVGR